MNYDLEFLKALLGLFSIIGATGSGVAALLVDYRDKKTGNTKWGRFAIFGLAISFLIGASNLWIDHIQKSRENRNAAETARINSEKTLQIVTGIERALNPFKDVRVTYSIKFPFDDPDLVRYRQRLDEGVRALVDGGSLIFTSRPINKPKDRPRRKRKRLVGASTTPVFFLVEIAPALIQKAHLTGLYPILKSKEYQGRLGRKVPHSGSNFTQAHSFSRTVLMNFWHRRYFLGER